MTEATGKAAEETAETIIELVETTPLWALMLAAAVGGAIVFFVMLSVSKAPASIATDGEA